VVAHLYHIAQQKLRYEIVNNRLGNTQKRLYFNLKITPSAAGGSAPDLRWSKLFEIGPPF